MFQFFLIVQKTGRRTTDSGSRTSREYRTTSYPQQQNLQRTNEHWIIQSHCSDASNERTANIGELEKLFVQLQGTKDEVIVAGAHSDHAQFMRACLDVYKRYISRFCVKLLLFGETV